MRVNFKLSRVRMLQMAGVLDAHVEVKTLT